MRHTPKSALQALMLLLMLALAPLASADPVVANQKLQVAKLNFAQVQLQHQIAVMLGGPERDEFFVKARSWIENRRVDEIFELCQAMRIPATPVGDGATVLEFPQYVSRQFFVTGGDERGAFRRPQAPYRFSKTALPRPGPAPRPRAPARPAQVGPRLRGHQP